MLGLKKKEIENIDKALVTIIAIVLTMSCAAVYSASFDAQADVIRDYYEKQVLWVVLGFAVFFFYIVGGTPAFGKVSPGALCFGLCGAFFLFFSCRLLWAQEDGLLLAVPVFSLLSSLNLSGY
ncbi:MAG: hypothetical protein LRY51_18080 [Geovibrio sp.]|nr:hypothetical protein [Geovibrio sp.]